MEKKKLRENTPLEMGRKVGRSPTGAVMATKENQGIKKNAVYTHNSGSSPYQGKLVEKKKSEKSAFDVSESGKKKTSTSGGGCPATPLMKKIAANKGYDPRTLLYISGGRLEDGETELEFVDTILNRRMKFVFQAQQVLNCGRGHQSIDQSEEEETGQAFLFVAVLPSPQCVQEVLKNVDQFKEMVSKNPDLEYRYGQVQFEEFLTEDELTIKTDMMKRVDDLNDRIQSLIKIFVPISPNGSFLDIIPPEFEWARAEIRGKNCFTHLGYEYTGKNFPGCATSETTVWWTSTRQPLAKKEYPSVETTRTSVKKGAGNGGKISKNNVKPTVKNKHFESKGMHQIDVDKDAGILF